MTDCAAPGAFVSIKPFMNRQVVSNRLVSPSPAASHEK